MLYSEILQKIDSYTCAQCAFMKVRTPDFFWIFSYRTLLYTANFKSIGLKLLFKSCRKATFFFKKSLIGVHCIQILLQWYQNYLIKSPSLRAIFCANFNKIRPTVFSQKRKH